MQTFSSFNSTLPIYPKVSAAYDFSTQTKRPGLPLGQAHEHRFQLLNYFPDVLTQAKHTRQVDMKKQPVRKMGLSNSTMRDSCYDPSMLNAILRKPKGILQFGDSLINRDKGGIIDLSKID